MLQRFSVYCPTVNRRANRENRIRFPQRQRFADRRRRLAPCSLYQHGIITRANCARRVAIREGHPVWQVRQLAKITSFSDRV